MHFHRRHLTQHRFQRIILWTLALLTWVAAMLGGERAVSARHKRQRFDISLPWLTRLVGKLVLLRAAQLARVRRRRRTITWARGRDLRRAHLIRSFLGARLRGKLRHKNIGVRIARLIDVLRNLDAYAAPLAKRLRRRLTRLWRTWGPIAPTPLLFGPPASTPAFPDSS